MSLSETIPILQFLNGTSFNDSKTNPEMVGKGGSAALHHDTSGSVMAVLCSSSG